jgi:AmmeMemoRadiSam system protein B
VAASAYACLLPLRGQISRVVLLGPAHRVWVRGVALSSAHAFLTPLGSVPVDTDALAVLGTMTQVRLQDDAHALEHSLEVHLPFLQVALGHFDLVPLVVGDASPKDVAAILEAMWGGPETLIVVSSDLSHYHDYDTARQLDTDTSRSIEALRYADIDPARACGCMPVNGLLHFAKTHGMQARTLDLRSSGDTAGPRNRVVGYGAYALQ